MRDAAANKQAGAPRAHPESEAGAEGDVGTILYYTILYYTIIYCTILYYNSYSYSYYSTM